MQPFFIDKCHKKLRLLAFAGCFLFVVVGDSLQIPWYYRFGFALLVVLYCRSNIRYWFFDDRIEKCRCRTSYNDFELFQKRSDRFRSPVEKPSGATPQEDLLASQDDNNSGRCLKTYPKSSLQKIHFVEEKLSVAVIFQFFGCAPQTERFLWTYCLRNRKTSFCVRLEKKDPNLATYIRFLDDYAADFVKSTRPV